MTQLTQGLGLDLADTLARDLEVLTNLFQGVVALLANAEAHTQDLLLTRSERLEHATGLIFEVVVDDRLHRGHNRLVLDEVAKVAVLLFADRGLERDRFLGDAQDLTDLVERHLHLGRDLFRVRLTAELLDQVA
jgi:hypothetical protein